MKRTIRSSSSANVLARLSPDQLERLDYDIQTLQDDGFDLNDPRDLMAGLGGDLGYDRTDAAFWAKCIRARLQQNNGVNATSTIRAAMSPSADRAVREVYRAVQNLYNVMSRYEDNIDQILNDPSYYDATMEETQYLESVIRDFG